MLQHVRTAAKYQNKGLIVIVNHYGRVNLVLLALALAGERLGMLTGTIDERNPQLDPVERRYLRRKVHTLRRYIGGRWVCLADDLRPLYRDLYAGGTLAFALDVYNPAMSVQRVAYPFLGGQLLLSPGIARIAARTKALMLYGVARESASASWQVEVDLTLLPASPEQGLAAAVRALERDVCAAPWAWWQWGVFNQLWKPLHVTP